MADSFVNRLQPDKPTTTVPVMPPPQSVSDVRFNTIGHAALLQRISAPTSDTQMLDDSSVDSSVVSRSPSPDLENELLPSSPEYRGASRPSLQARMTLDSPSNNGSHPQSLEADGDQSMPQSRNAQHTTTEKLSPLDGQINIPQRIVSKPPDSGFVDKFSTSIAPSVSRARISPAASCSSNNPTTKKRQADNVLVKGLPSDIVNAGDNATTDVLKEIQVRLVSVVENLNPLDTDNALALVRSVQDKCSEVHSSARDAHMHAESALQSAQKSMDAARHCIEMATSLQTYTDDVITAIDKLSQTSLSHHDNWNDTLNALKQDLHSLSQWAQQREAEDARLQSVVEEKAALQAAHAKKAQHKDTNSNGNKSSNTIDIAVPQNNMDGANSSQLMDVDEDETTSEWNKFREQNETERKAIEEKLQRHRQEEAIVEQRRAQALAEAEAQNAELIRRQAERSEFERQLQHQQMREAELAEKMRFKQEEAQRKANEERTQKAKVKDQANRLQAEKERKVRLKIEQEKAQALERRRLEEEERMKRLKEEQEVKRLQIAETKKQSAAETAKEINANRQSRKSLDLNTSTGSVPFVTTSTSPVDRTKDPVAMSKPNKTGPLVQNQNLQDMIDTNAPPSSSSKAGKHTSVKLPTIQQLIPAMGSTQQGKPMDASSLPYKPECSVTSSNHSVDANSPGTIKHNQLPALPTPALIGKDKNQALVQYAKKSSLPPSIQQPRSAMLPPRPETNPPGHVLVFSRGRDISHVPIVPQSQIPPISPEAQRANLRNLMPNILQPKQDLVEGKPVLKGERLSNGPVSSKLIPVSTSVDLPKKPKVEPVDDIPPLSIPSPDSRIAKRDEVQRSHFTPFNEGPKEQGNNTSSEHAFRGRSPNPTALAQPLPTARANANSAQSGQQKSNGISGHRDAQSAPTRSLPPRPAVPVTTPPKMLTSSMPDLSKTPRGDYFNEFDGMGNDPSMSNGWNQLDEDDEDIYVRQPEEGISAPMPRPSTPSPPPPPRPSTFSRNPATSRRGRGRRVDHYSPPRRSPPPPLPYSRYSAEPQDRERRSSNSRGSGSVNNSRGVSPDTRPPYNVRYDLRRSMSPAPNPMIGKKRTHDDQDAGPPYRRPRLAGQESAHHDKNPARPPPASSSNRFEEDWSHAAEYGRSPSPNPHSRGPSLQARINDRVNGPPPVQGLSHLGGKPYNHNRHNGSDESGAPHLLNRLSDGNSQHYSAVNSRGPPRPRNPKSLSRPPHQPPQEYRPSKAPLIDRLQIQR